MLNAILIPLGLSFASFLGSWAVYRHRIAELEKKTEEQGREIARLKATLEANREDYHRTRERDEKNINARFNDVDYKRELLKDTLIQQMHNISNKVTEIHTIVTKSN